MPRLPMLHEAQAPRWRPLLAGTVLAFAGIASAGPGPAGAPFLDPLDTPAARVAHAQRKPMMALAHAGPRIVAAGMRGVIVFSDDAGRTWQQADSPVQSDLTALTFVDERRGWAVGHDGVILATDDGGRTWTKQLDGRVAARAFADHYRAARDAGAPGAERWLQEIERNYRNGPVLPFLDVAFEDAQRGFAVGPFGMIAATTDGGRTWTPWLEHIDNPDLLSLYAARRIGDTLYLTAERGTVYRLDRRSRSFVRLTTGYAGSLFGIAGQGRLLVAYGLRGTLASSDDGGEHWAVRSLPVPLTITGATALPDGRVMLANIAGMLWVVDAGGGVTPLAPSAAPVTALQALPEGRLALAGLGGVQVQPSTSPARP